VDNSQSAGVPVVSFVGRSGSGKTTLLEKVIAELTSRGYRVASVKHHTHHSDIDVPGKDSWRHAKAGSKQVVLKGLGVLAVFKKIDSEPDLNDLLAMIDDADIVLTEGFHEEGKAMIEVSRRGCSAELINEPSSLLALVTDNDFDAGTTPVFGLNEHMRVVELLESVCLAGGGVD
jgi:molybdopterin-guanine dinucleotide biosynthesis adapter protein